MKRPIVFLVILLVITCALAPTVATAMNAADEAAVLKKKNWLLGIAFRYEGQRADLAAQMQKRDVAIAKVKDIIQRAKGAGDAKAEQIASKALATNEETKFKYAVRKQRVETALAEVRQMIAQSDEKLRDCNGFVTGLHGEVQYYSASAGKWMTATSASLRQIKAGDSLVTGPDSGAEVHLRDDDGVESRLKLGASTKLKVQTCEPGIDESLELMLEKGGLHVEDKATGPQAEEVKKKRGEAIDKFMTCVSNSKNKEDYYSCLKKFALSPFASKIRSRTSSTGCAVRSTEYVLSDDGQGNTKCLVLEGSVLLYSLKQGKAVMVETGQVVSVSAAGEFAPPAKPDANDRKAWWAE